MSFLSVNNLTKEFGGLRALHNLSFSIGEGSLWGLVGPNGAGKTTCYNVITGFLKPTSGTVSWQGVDITKLRPDQIAKRGIVRTFQQTNLFSEMTVMENTLAGFHNQVERGLPIAIAQAFFHGAEFNKRQLEIRSQAMEILDILELKDRSDTIAKNLAHVDQRKLEIAIALAGQPKLLLLDEPAAGMHPDEIGKLTRTVKMLQQRGLTILLVEHNMRFVMSTVERIIVLSYGSKIVEGTPAEIRNNEDVIRIYLGSRKNA